jgi:adenylate kinase family enzyme
MPEWKQALAHVLWIGGATDSGKSPLAQKLAERERYPLQIYHYDQHDIAHHQRLAEALPTYQAFIKASLDERWVDPEPEELFQRALSSFRDRFPMVIEDLLAYPSDRQIIAEGFGLLPDLLAPLLTRPEQALWLVPTEAFKQASMQRRGKPNFGPQISNREKAKMNLIQRDKLLAAYITEQVQKYGFTLYEVDEANSLDEMVNKIEHHFASVLVK